MDNKPIILTEVKFSRELIYVQLQRIFSDPVFVNSKILREFLAFIVDQTLSGHSNWLKEYTIGINVLNKSTDFKPHDNGIVRIHAGRLRRALHHYYKDAGALDPIEISIPKGGYVPVFSDCNHNTIQEELNTEAKPLIDSVPSIETKSHAAIAVIPFQHFHKNSLENSLVDGLGLQLSNAIMQYDKYPVIAYYTMRELCKTTTDIVKIASFVDARYIITGSIQTLEKQVRSHCEIIDSHTGKQLWSCMYKGQFTSEHIFKLQDEIVHFIISELNKVFKFGNDKMQHISMMVVA